MVWSIRRFLRGDDGQDLAEYCLLTALVALVAAGILFHVSGGLESLWGAGRQNLNTANAVVQSNGVTGASNH